MRSYKQRINMQTVLFFMTTMISFIGLTLFVLQLDRTFGFRDEAFYALNMEQPFNNIYKVSDCNIYFSCLYYLFNENLYKVRLFWFVFQFASGMMAGFCLCFMFSRLGCKLTKLNVWTVILVVATTTCSYYSTRYFTPSYNTWNLTWILICLSSLFLYSGVVAGKDDKIKLNWRYICILSISLSGSMIFLSKPTSAIGMALVAISWILFLPNKLHPVNRLHDVVLAAIITVLILVLHYEFVSEGLMVNYEKYKIGMEFFEKRQTHKFGDMLTKYFNFHEFHSLHLTGKTSMFSFFVLAGLFFKVSSERKFFYIISLVFFFIAVFTGIHYISTHGVYILGHFSLWVLLSALVIWILLRTKCSSFSGNTLVMFVLLVISVISYEFGSENRPAVHLTSGFALSAIASIAILITTDKAYRSSLISFWGFCLVLFSLSSLLPTFKAPQGGNIPLSLHYSKVIFREGTRPLKLTRSQQKVLNDVKRAALTHGWKSDTPIINLITTYTAVPYYLKARQLAGNWAFRPFHINTMTWVWLYAHVSRIDIENAWIICASEPSDQSFFSTKILEKIGIDFPTLYNSVYTDESLQVWKPK